MPSAKIKNTTTSSRTGVVTLGVPFTKGQLQTTDRIVVSGAYTLNNDNQQVQWYPQGVRWDDGSVKYARVSFTTDLTSLQEKTVSINKSATTTPESFLIKPSTWTNFHSTSFSFTIQGFTFTIPTASMTLLEGGGVNDHYARYKYFSYLPHSAIDLYRRRIWVELVADFYTNADHVQIYFRFGHYKFDSTMPPGGLVDPRLTLTSPVTLTINGGQSRFRWEDAKLADIQTVSSTHRVYTLINPLAPWRTAFLTAGVSHAYKGIICFGSSSTITAELEEQILGMAVDWKNIYPISGIQPSIANHSYITSEANALARSNTLLNIFTNQVRNRWHPYTWPGCVNNPNTGGTGTHGFRDYAFGLRGFPFLSTTNYNWIPYLEFATRQMATRHNWYVGSDGQPVPPNTFHAAGARIWNGAFWDIPSTGTFNYTGYSRKQDPDDCPGAVGVLTQEIYGPDKEHFTLHIHILQALISMDYFSLVFANMYANFWMYANRVRNYGTGYNSFSEIDGWGTARAIGRQSLNVAFLYEFTGNTELRFWIEERLSYNYWAVSFGHTPFSFKRELVPGGTEVVRALVLRLPCDRGSCLNDQQFWTPWEEAHGATGNYFLAKCLLTENPNSTAGALYLQLARDAAASVLQFGYLDCRQPNSTRRSIILGVWSTQAQAEAWVASNQIALGLQVTGLTSGATGRIIFYAVDLEHGSTGGRVIIHLNQAQGTFVVGEVLRLSTGHQQTIWRIEEWPAGYKSHASVTSNGFARGMTEVDKDTLQLGHVAFNFPQWFPVGIWRYGYHYVPYAQVNIGTASIVLEAARENWYPDSNASLQTLAQGFINDFFPRLTSDNGDFNEEFEAYAGYLVPSILSTSRIINAPVLQSLSSFPTPTITVTNQRIDTTVNLDTFDPASSLTFATAGVTIATTTSANVLVSPNTSRMRVLTPRGTSVGSGTVVQAPSSSLLAITPSNVFLVYTQATATGIRRFTYVFLGVPEQGSTTYNFVHETPFEPIFPTIGNPWGPGTYHRSLTLTVIGNPVTDYALTTPIRPIIGLLGEAVGLNGQSLRAQGYTWYIGSESADPWDEEQIVVTSTDYTHTISQTRKGAWISQWSTLLVESGNEVSWLRRVGPHRGFGIYEKYRFNVGEAVDDRVYQPNFGGAIGDGTLGVFLSPLRYRTNSSLGNGQVKIEGAVTPLGIDSYGAINNLYGHGGSPTNPEISLDMKQYYCIGVDVGGPGVSQIDTWSFQPTNFPDDNQELTHGLAIHLIKGFTQCYFYNLAINFAFNVSDLLLTRQTNLEATTHYSRIWGTQNDPTLGSFDQKFVSIFAEGYGAVILHNPDKGITIALAAKIYGSSTELTLPTLIGVTNQINLDREEGIDSDSGSVLRLESTEIAVGNSVSRVPGWIGLRSFLIIRTNVEAAKAACLNLYQNGTLDLPISGDGLFTYERPAII